MREGLNIFLAIILVNFLYNGRHTWIAARYFSIFLHELSHYIVALLLFAKPEFPKIRIDTNNNETVITGEVVAYGRGIRSSIIGLAPLILPVLVLFIYNKMQGCCLGGLFPLVYFVGMYPFYASGFPSGKDIEAIVSSIFGILLFVLIVTGIVIYFSSIFFNDPFGVYRLPIPF